MSSAFSLWEILEFFIFVLRIFIFLFGHTAVISGVLVFDQKIKPAPGSESTQIPNHWNTREPLFHFFNISH